MTITNGQELSDWLYDDGAYDYYKEEIIAGYTFGCMHCSRWDGDDDSYDEYDDEDIDEYASENDISLEDCNGPDDLDYRTFREYEKRQIRRRREGSAGKNRYGEPQYQHEGSGHIQGCPHESSQYRR